MPQHTPTTEEKFKCLVEGIQDSLKKAKEEVDRREQRLGAEVADHPTGDHSCMIASVHESRAVVEAIKELWHLGGGLFTGQLLPKKSEA